MPITFDSQTNKWRLVATTPEEENAVITAAIQSIMGRFVIFRDENVQKVKEILREGAYLRGSEEDEEDDEPCDDPDCEIHGRATQQTHDGNDTLN
jgi:hypothetical protein